jgi:hypothetical protein
MGVKLGLTLNGKQRLGVFENRVLTKMFGQRGLNNRRMTNLAR